MYVAPECICSSVRCTTYSRILCVRLHHVSTGSEDRVMRLYSLKGRIIPPFDCRHFYPYSSGDLYMACFGAGMQKVSTSVLLVAEESVLIHRGQC
jgi:hypothetical protein